MTYLMTKQEFASAINMGSTKVHEMVRTGEVRSVKIGASVRIPASEVDALVARLLTVGIGSESAVGGPLHDLRDETGPIGVAADGGA